MTSAPLRAAVRLAAGCLLAGLGLVAVSTPALAHDQLIDSFPAADEQLGTAPTAVRLDFTDDVLTIGAAVVVVDNAGQTWSSGEPVLDGSSVSVAVVPDMPDGSYEVRWRVVSSDGHVISDTVPFTVGDATSATTSVPDGSEGVPDAAEGSDVPPAEASGAGDPDGPASTAWRTVAVAAVGAVVGVALYGALLAVRGRRTRGTPGADAASG